MEKKRFYTQIAYVLGIITLAFGTALMEKADFGMSMVVAPAYLLHLKVSEFLPFFTFGMAEYVFQALLLIVIMIILKRFKISLLFSFVTAVIYGLVLDAFLLAVSPILAETMAVRVICYAVGMLFCTAGVSLLFNSDMPPEAYELFVKEISGKFNFDLHKCKTVYDCASCVLAILMSFAFFGLWHFEGIKLGTIVCTLINGWLIGRWTYIFKKIFVFKSIWQKA